ncbi:MAG: trypsin-like serine protease, partial [Polyangiaceae bacterium]|nr:trypsin-like serine protease [Polyangiaceae bacterium]
MVRRTCSAWIVLGLAVTACSADDELSGRAPLTPPGRELDDRVGRARAAIIDGVPAPDDDAVVVVSHVEMGELCTGTLVSRRVIVTAKHCTVGAEPSGIAIGFGDTVEQARDATVYSADHRATPGMVIDGQDVAVVVLREDAPVEPVPFSRDAALRPLL